jgi:spoIIIJ-associated protein
VSKVTVRGKTVEEAVESALDQLQTTREQVHVEVVQQPRSGFLGIGSRPAVVEVTLADDQDSPQSDGQQQDSTALRGTTSVPQEEEDVGDVSRTNVGQDRTGLSSAKEREVLRTDAAGRDLARGRRVTQADRTGAADEEAKDGSTDYADPEAVGKAVDSARRFLEQVLADMDVEVEVRVDDKQNPILFDLTGPRLGAIIGRRGQTLDALQYLTNIVANRHVKQYVRIVLDAENYRERRKQTLQELADRLAKKAIRTHQKVALEPMNPAERKIIHTHLQHYANVSTKSEGKEPFRKVVVYPTSAKRST